MAITMSNLTMLQSSNPLLFSRSQYGEYPTGYAELKRYLQQHHTTPRPLQPNAVDYHDSMMFSKRDDEIDLEKKLAVEYALFKAMEKYTDGKLLTQSEVSFTKLQLLNKKIHLLKAKKEGATDPCEQNDLNEQLLDLNNDFCDQLLQALYSINFEYVSSHDSTGHSQNFDQSLANKSMTIQTDDHVEELTSYLISSAIQKGIELKPDNETPDSSNEDSGTTQFFKSCIDSLLDKCSNNENLQIDDDVSELQTALKDLQLAHSFLTKKFENDRTEYLHNIDKLNRTNKELSQELLNYHARLSDMEQKCKRFQEEKTQLQQEQYSKVTKGCLESPSIPPPDVYPASPMSIGSSGSGSYSFSVVRAEFKKILADMQKKHEKALQEEVEKRTTLEEELNRLRQ